MISTKAKLISILDGWFGETLEHAEDEAQRRKYLYEPLIKLVEEKSNDDIEA